MIHTATAVWNGTLKDGSGKAASGNGHFELPYTFASRFTDDKSATNPEELIGAAHAGCFSMFFSALATKDGFTPTSIEATASVHLGKDESGPMITKIELEMKAVVPNMGQEQFAEMAQAAKDGCPISRLLAAVPEMSMSAVLLD